MLAEQAIDEAAQALLNSRRSPPRPTRFAAMLDTSRRTSSSTGWWSLVQDAGRAAESVATTVRPRIGSSAT
jgi:hypothetical protein